MTRLCIFSFYDSDGRIRTYIDYLLSELKTCSSHIIFAVNGIINDEGRKIVNKYTADIFIRDNKGFDVGAYKDVICKYLNNDLSNYDEIIFCNNSFWGPFLPLNKIFRDIEIRGESDFWGLCYTENNFANHIPGMFMVFKQNIVSNGLLQKYFVENIDENTKIKNWVIASYEIGLFDYLVRKNNMKFQCFSNLKALDLYTDAEICIRKYNFPMLKRRIGEKKYYEKKKIVNALKYIENNYDYDIKIILDDLEEDFGIKLTKEEVLSSDYEHNNTINGVLLSDNNYSDLKKFTEKEFYIMGTGFYALQVWWLYGRNNEKFLGFFISDGQPFPEELFFKDKTSYFSKIDLKGKRVVVAMNKEKSMEVSEILLHDEVLYLSL